MGNNKENPYIPERSARMGREKPNYFSRFPFNSILGWTETIATDLVIFLSICPPSFLHNWKPFVILGGNGLADTWAFLAVRTKPFSWQQLKSKIPTSVCTGLGRCVAASTLCGRDNILLSFLTRDDWCFPVCGLRTGRLSWGSKATTILIT